MSDPRDPRRAAWVIVYAALGFACVSRALGYALDFNGSPGDGPLQLFNALRRITAGQPLGGTFQYFHGPGFPYLHAPFYLILGQGIFASEASRQLVSALSFLLVIPVALRPWTRSWREAVLLGSAVLIAHVGLGLDQLVLADNGSLGLRSAVPLVFAAHLALRRSRFAAVERGLLLSLAVLIGSEHGMALVAAYVVTGLSLAARTRNRTAPAEIAVAFATAVLSYCVVILLVAGPTGFGSVVRFQFSLIPADQFWYFGAPPAEYLAEWSHLARLMDNPGWTIATFGGIIAGVWAIRTPAEKVDSLTAARLVLGLYALLSLSSLLGRLAPGYMQPAARVGIILAFGVAWHHRPVNHGVGVLAAMALVVAGSLVAHPREARAYAGAPVYLARNLARGPRLSDRWTATLDTAARVMRDAGRGTGEAPLWSTYAGLVESRASTFTPSFDYMIHTLGAGNRAGYVDQFRRSRPRVVQTIRPGFMEYEEWLESNHWEFYRELLANYRVEAVGPWSLFWVRDSVARDTMGLYWTGTLPEGASTASMTLPASPTTRLVEVTVVYRARQRILGRLDRNTITIERPAGRLPIVLAPYARERRFPIVVAGDGRVDLSWRTISLLGDGMPAVERIELREVLVGARARAWFEEMSRWLARPR